MKTEDDFYEEFDNRIGDVVSSDAYMRHIVSLRENLWAPLVFAYVKVEATYCFSALLDESMKARFVDGPLAYFRFNCQFMPTDDLAAGRSFKDRYCDLIHLCMELKLNEKAKKSLRRVISDNSELFAIAIDPNQNYWNEKVMTSFDFKRYREHGFPETDERIESLIANAKSVVVSQRKYDVDSYRILLGCYRDCLEIDGKDKEWRFLEKHGKRLEKWDDLTTSDPLLWEKDWQGI